MHDKGTHPIHLTQRNLFKFFCTSLILFALALVSASMNSESYAPDNAESLYPCGKCQTPVTYDHKGLQCDTCSMWYHAPCQRVGDQQYEFLAESSCSWHCTRCNSHNFSSRKTQDLSSFDTGNTYSILDQSPDFSPLETSTPHKSKQPKKTKTTDTPLKIANINFRSIRGKKPQFYSFLDFHNPDIVIGTETWLTPDIHDSELFPPDLGYTVYRRDRTGPKGGGVIILVKSSFQSQAKPEFNTNAEIIWIQLNLIGSKSALIGAYYKPHELDQTSFDELGKSLDLIKQSNSQIWLLGDFNLPKIDWELLTPTPDCDYQTFYTDCLETFSDCLLEQMVTSPTRGPNTLDLFFTTNPTLVKTVSVIPGLSDHDIVLAEVNSRPQLTKQVPRDIPLYKKADWDQLKQSMRDLYEELQSSPATTDIQVLWDKFAGRLQHEIDTHIPIRKAGTKDGFPWINQEIRRLIRKRDKLYRRWSRSGRPDDQKKFLDQKHLVRRITDRAYEKYLKDILGINNDGDDLDDPPKVKTKKLYSLLKHSKQDSSGIASLKADNKTYTEDSEKANALNGQFHSVFSPKSPISLKQLAQRTLQDLHDSGLNQPLRPSPHPKMPEIHVSQSGIEKLLKGLNPHKAAGPDKFKPIVLQTLHKELAPILQLIYQRSLDSGKLPSIWKEANVSPIFKKGDKSDPANYRPISLTCVLCKVLEHVVASSISRHFTEQNILFDLQHGFREKRSCETQLIMLVDELAKNMQAKKQTDLILLDFSKAFDKVAHEKLLLKLHFYGIRGNTLNWIKDFLDNRSQSVLLNGSNSDSIPVSSGVPQGSVLGPILFLAYINDLPDQVKSRVRLFADDTAMYLALDKQGDSEILQKDLESLEKWEKLWDMSFNPSKCQVIHVTRSKSPSQAIYYLHGCALESVSSAKYLGVTVSEDLSWSDHINNITKKANQTLGFIKRNIRVHNRDLKSTAYKTLVRPQLEYASTVWSPHTDQDIGKLESVQRRAARWVTRDYRQTSSVSTMLQDLNWRTLDQRRIDSRLVLLYKVTYDLVAIPASDYLIRNTRPSSRNHSYAYRQITTLRDYYKYTFFPRTIIHWNALPPHIPVLPTLAQFSIAVCQIAHKTP